MRRAPRTAGLGGRRPIGGIWLPGPADFGYFLFAGVAEAKGIRYTCRVMAVLGAVAIASVWGAAALLSDG